MLVPASQLQAGHIVAPVAVPVGTPRPLGWLEEHAHDLRAADAEIRREQAVECVVEFRERGVIGEGLLVEREVGHWLQALGLRAALLASQVPRLVADSSQIGDQGKR